MKRTLAALTMTAALAASGAAFAQQPAAQAPAGQDGGKGRWQMSEQDRSAFTDARIAAIKAGLKLTPEQEKLWPQTEQVLRDAAKTRAERFAKWREQRQEARANPDKRMDMIERMRGGATRMTDNAQSLTKLADGIEPLYKSLDDAQKRRLAVLIRSGMERRHFAAHMGRMRQAAE